MWLIRRNHSVLLQQTTNGYILDVDGFHSALIGSLGDYLSDIVQPTQGGATLRANLWTKMDQIRDTRNNRGGEFAANSP